MAENDADLPPELIAQEALHLHALPPRSPERDAELAREVARLNAAIAAAARELSFDDQPVDFLAMLLALREREDEAP